MKKDKSRQLQQAGKKESSIVRSSAAEYLTFVAAIIAAGYKVNSERAVQFRKWVKAIIQEFTIKGYTMDDERLKNDGSVLGRQYFEEQLQRIREIRLSERKFYPTIFRPSQKIIFTRISYTTIW